MPSHPAAAAVRTVHARTSGGGLRLRPGQPSDASTLRRLALKEWLNPLGLDPKRFTVAERGGRTIGIGQLKPLDGGRALQLATLVVEDGERGCGVGAALVQELVQRAGGTPIFLTTSSMGMGLFERCGFGLVQRTDAPARLQAEYLAGLMVAWLLARDRPVLMRCRPGGGGASRATGGASRATGGASRATDTVVVDDDNDITLFSRWWWQLGEDKEPPKSADSGSDEPPESAWENGGASNAGDSGAADGGSSAGWQWPDLGGLGSGGSDSYSGGGDSYGGGGGSYGGGGGSYGGGFDSYGGGFDSGDSGDD